MVFQCIVMANHFDTCSELIYCGKLLMFCGSVWMLVDISKTTYLCMCSSGVEVKKGCMLDWLCVVLSSSPRQHYILCSQLTHHVTANPLHYTWDINKSLLNHYFDNFEKLNHQEVL